MLTDGGELGSSGTRLGGFGGARDTTYRRVTFHAPVVLHRAVTLPGFDADALIEGASQQEVKDALFSGTKRAIDAGACGVPTFQVRSHRGARVWRHCASASHCQRVLVMFRLTAVRWCGVRTAWTRL